MDQLGVASETLQQSFPEGDAVRSITPSTIESFDENGILTQRATYLDGVLEGEFLAYNPQGTVLKKFLYRQGKLHGEALIYNNDGQLTQRLTYEEGVLNGPFQVFTNDVLVIDIPFVKGAREGVARFFAPNGRIQSEVTFKADKENGVRTTYNSESGMIVRKEILVEGTNEGQCLTYYPSGAAMLQQKYEKGLLQGPCVQLSEDGKVQQMISYDKGIIMTPTNSVNMVKK